jgi:hypothetical protein
MLLYQRVALNVHHRSSGKTDPGFSASLRDRQMFLELSSGESQPFHWANFANYLIFSCFFFIFATLKHHLVGG